MIKSVRYGETFNTGNYESLRIDAEVEVTGKRTAEACLAEARKFVRNEYKKMRETGLKYRG